MDTHPLNLGLRFLLEVAALLVLGFWGAAQGTGPVSFGLALGIPLLAAAAWGTFNVKNDPSRSGKAPIAVPGVLRLALEVVLFAAATVALFDVADTMLAIVFLIIVAGHYAVSYQRIAWLLRQP